jgi:tetratricopeptide (TPR) repeat protein
MIVPRIALVWIPAIAVLALALAGCEKSASELSNQGNVALVQQDFDGAIASFNQALAKDPSSFDAMLGLAQAYTKKNDFPKAHEYFDKSKALVKDTDPQKPYMDEKLQELYLAEAVPLKDKDPAAYEAKLMESVKVRDRGGQANTAYFELGELFMSRGEQLGKDPKTRDKAIEYYEKMNTIKTQASLRKKARVAAQTLYRQRFADKFKDEVTKLKPQLLKEGLLDEPGGRVKVVILIEDKELNPKTDEDKAAIRKTLAHKATSGLIDYSYAFAGFPRPDSVPNLFTFQSAKVEEEVIERGKAQLGVSVALSEVEQIAYDVIVVPAREAATVDPTTEAKPAPTDAPAAPTADAGVADEKPDADAPKNDADAPKDDAAEAD